MIMMIMRVVVHIPLEMSESLLNDVSLTHMHARLLYLWTVILRVKTPHALRRKETNIF